jgi:hypothetical protein
MKYAKVVQMRDLPFRVGMPPSIFRSLRRKYNLLYAADIPTCALHNRYYQNQSQIRNCYDVATGYEA